MRAELLNVPNLQFSRVSYVTVKVDSKATNEYEDFFKRMSIRAEDRFQRDEINRRIGEMGEIYGAQDEFFERENLAESRARPHRRLLASEGDGCLGVCLCCIRLSEDLVVLLNGDRRTARWVGDCPICSPHYDLASRISDAIYDAQMDGLIELRDGAILAEAGFSLKL